MSIWTRSPMPSRTRRNAASRSVSVPPALAGSGNSHRSCRPARGGIGQFASPHRHADIERADDLIYGAAGVPGDVDADLGHDPHGERMHSASDGAGALGNDAVAALGTQEALGHLRARGVVATEE